MKRNSYISPIPTLSAIATLSATVERKAMFAFYFFGRNVAFEVCKNKGGDTTTRYED